MLDASHLDLNAVKLLATGYALLCGVVQLQGLQLLDRGKDRAQVFWLDFSCFYYWKQ